MHWITCAFAAVVSISPLTEYQPAGSCFPLELDGLPISVRRVVALTSGLQAEADGDLPRAHALLAAHLDDRRDPLAVALSFHAARIGLALGEPADYSQRALFAGPGGPLVRWGITRKQEAEALLALADRLGDSARAAQLRDFAAIEYPRWAFAPEQMDGAALLQRARNLVRDMDYAGALSLLEDISAAQSGKQRRDRLREIGRLIGDKIRDGYERVAEIYGELAAGPAGTPDDLLYLAYAAGKLDDELAAETYRAFIRRFPDHPLRSKPSFFLAWTQFNLEHFAAAVAAFDAFLGEFPSSSYRFVAHWYRGLSHFRLGDFAAARVDFEYTAHYTSNRDKGRYWTARAMLEAGELDAAESLLVDLAANDPFSYYGILARSLLPQARRPSVFDATPLTVNVGINAAAAEQLIARLPAPSRDLLDEAFAAVQVGHPDLAAALLEHLEARALAPSRFAELRRWLQPRLGATDRFIRSADARRCRRSLDSDPRVPGVGDCWRALYPRPYAELIDAVRGDVPAELFWAIMRQESYFMPAARSHADALGLMQVIPQVGGPAARALGREFAPYELYRPSTNLEIFAHAANERFARLGGHIPLILMSYNATVEKAEAWLVDNHDLPFDLFVEEIPYGETRDYVKNIAAHLARYRTLAGADALPLIERAGLPHPTMLASEAFADVLASGRIGTAYSPGASTAPARMARAFPVSAAQRKPK